MPVRKGNAVWSGDLKSGNGTVSVESGTFDSSYSFASRFEQGAGTNPDELIGAALAACFSMALSNELAKDGHTPTRVATEARVHLSTDGGAHLERIDLVCEAEVPGIDEATFAPYADGAKSGCPVSKALAGVEITLQATLSS